LYVEWPSYQSYLWPPVVSCGLLWPPVAFCGVCDLLNLEMGAPRRGPPQNGQKRSKMSILSSTIVRVMAKPPKSGKGSSQKGYTPKWPEKVQNEHSVIYDCTWNGQATKIWKRELPEGVRLLWPAVASCGLLWPSVASCGLLWPPVASCGLLWPSVAPCGLLWPSVASCGPLWPPVASCGILWPKPGKGSSQKGSTPKWPEKVQNEHSVIYDCTWPSHQNLETGAPRRGPPQNGQKRSKMSILSSTIVRGMAKPPKSGKGSSQKGSTPK
jgi:hypothetical protein